MRFKRTAVAPQGRNKYGDYLSSSNVTKKVIKTSYYGDASNNEIDGGGSGRGTTGGTEDDGNWILDLSLKAYDFDGSMLPTTTSTKTIDVIGYRKRSRADTFIGDISTTATSETYSISGIPESGMTISVDDNGTPQTKINITISSGISETEGVLQIPVSLYLKSIPGEPLDDDISAWNSSSADCVTEIFEFSWRVVNFSNSVYTLDLTNESASINCDADGNILPDAVRPTCRAIVYLGTSALTSGVTFTMTSPQAQNLQGVSINTTTGVLTFGSNFAFDGTAIEITISAQHVGNNAGTAIMNVAKAYPGADGKPATSYWLVLSANAVRVSNNIATPNNITAQAMMQVGEDAPTAATDVSIYYGFDTEYPSTAYPSSGVTVIISHAYISFVLKKGNVIVDVETVPIVVNGTDGVSPYRLDLSNDNASINCDSAWNILPTAYRPKCTAKLWQGTNEVTGVTYALFGASCSYSGATIDSTTGVITLGEGSSAEPFWFDKNYTAIEFNVYAYIGQSLVAASVFTISRSIAGTDGADGKSITGVTEHYALSNNGTTAPTSGWTTTIQTPTASLPYLWNYEQIDFSSGAPKTTSPVVIAYYTKDGKGISAITEYYAINDSTVVAPTSWSTSMAVPTAGNPYLWNYEVITYSDGTTASTSPVIIGIRGEKGADGRSITGVTEYYALNNDRNTPPTTGWSTAISSPTESNPFLWNYESIGYNTGNPTTTTPVIIARYTKDGKGVSAITEYYAINNSTVTAPTTWHTTVQIPTDSNPYLWNYELVTYTDGSTSSTTPVIIGIKGVDGTSGESAVSYWLEMDYTDVKVTSAGTYTPATITITKKKQVGGSAPVTTSDGVIKYGYDTVAPSTTYSNGIKTTGATNYITVHYLVDNVIRDNETILVIHDGKDGQSIEGRQGAAVRGPVNWYTAMEESGRRWCNGSGATGTQDAQWIDIILKDGVYYYCNTSYTEAGQSWESVSSKWTSAGEQFDFIATNLLLANNAKISAFTGNDIYVMSGNTVVGGIQGSGNTFCWAGANEPANATFKVDYDGTIHASKGEFSGYVRVPYVNYTGLTTTTTTLNGSTISGKEAGENAYIMKVSGSTTDKLILPEPTESLAGMTYRIIVGSYMELYFKGADGTAKHFNIAQTPYGIKKIIARYGYIELTCMLAPYGTRGSAVWSWAVTAFNGNLELYHVAITTQGSEVLFDKAITPIYGMSLVTGDTYTVKYINADDPLPSDANKSSDTIYVSRT